MDIPVDVFGEEVLVSVDPDGTVGDVAAAVARHLSASTFTLVYDKRTCRPASDYSTPLSGFCVGSADGFAALPGPRTILQTVHGVTGEPYTELVTRVHTVKAEDPKAVAMAELLLDVGVSVSAQAVLLKHLVMAEKAEDRALIERLWCRLSVDEIDWGDVISTAVQAGECGTAGLDLLLAQGISIDSCATTTALMSVAGDRDLAAAKALLARGADPNVKAPRGGNTALHVVLQQPFTATHRFARREPMCTAQEMVCVLLGAGARVATQNTALEVPAHLYVAGPPVDLDAELLQRLLEDGADKLAGVRGTTVLHTAIVHNNVPAVCMLLERAWRVGNPDVSAASRATRGAAVAALPLAVQQEGTPLGRLLLERNAKGQTALHVASLLSLPCVEVLLTWGADPSAVDNRGATPLHCAVASLTCATVKVLVKAGAPLNAQRRSDGATALHIAAKFKNKATAQSLVESGADLDIADLTGKKVRYAELLS
eukprot:Rhum_TRINITY_DN20912_c0_g1::Rhum_TRINITY_DN20912_c0_g1_i1::g.172574::m.172574